MLCVRKGTPTKGKRPLPFISQRKKQRVGSVSITARPSAPLRMPSNSHFCSLPFEGMRCVPPMCPAPWVRESRAGSEKEEDQVTGSPSETPNVVVKRDEDTDNRSVARHSHSTSPLCSQVPSSEIQDRGAVDAHVCTRRTQSPKKEGGLTHVTEPAIPTRRKRSACGQKGALPRILVGCPAATRVGPGGLLAHSSPPRT